MTHYMQYEIHVWDKSNLKKIILVQCETWQLCNMEYDTHVEYDTSAVWNMTWVQFRMWYMKYGTCVMCNVTNMQSEMWHLCNMEYDTCAFWNMIHVEYGIYAIWIVILVQYEIWLLYRNITLVQYWNNIALI
jgi:hypothetical protein